VLLGKNVGTENPYLFQNIWFFIFWQNSFTYFSTKGEQENVRLSSMKTLFSR
jgi:hypothetical protein